MTTERDMLDLLMRRHAATNKFGFPRWVYAEKVYEFSLGREVDAIAMDGHGPPYEHRRPGLPAPYTRPYVHGFEVKVSRGDWLREMHTDGAKSFLWRRYCSHWWLVVPDRSIVRPEELPEGWGLLVGARQLRTVVPATATEPVDIPHRTYTTIGRAALRTAARSTDERRRTA